jgi:energy-coupling factor transport system permease protein
MIYRRAASPLHAARAAAGSAYCAALAAVALVADHPVILAAVLIAEVGAASAAGAGRQFRRAALFTAPFALAIAVINPIVTRDGLTVIARAGEVPWLGNLDITLEATAYGGVLALRAVALVLAGALYASAVDPDEVLRLFRRVSFRSALTAALATRMVPVLARDAGRLAEAQRCRPAGSAPRLAVVRATATNALDRAIDVAATLELRGYSLPGPRGRQRREPSRYDARFYAVAAVVVVTAIVGKVAGADDFHPYPTIHIGLGGATLAVCAVVLASGLAPLRVARRRRVAGRAARVEGLSRV